jgi:PAS domain-containing protein/CheY-like chemotaxis protein
MPPPASPPGDDRCLAGLAAALGHAAAGSLERALAGLLDALAGESVALLDLAGPLRALAARERRPTGEAEVRLPPAWVAALVDGRVVRGAPGELGAGERAALRLPPAAALLLAPVPGLEGPPAAALLLAANLADGTWSSGQEVALRGLAGGLGGWVAARGLQQVLDALPQRIAWKDGGLRYRGANRAFARAAGVGSLVGRSDDELGPRPEVGASPRREREALAGPAQVHRLEAAALPGGRELVLDVSRAPLDGGGLVIAVDDVGARVQLAAQLQQAQRVAAVGRLAAGVGDDLRPIAADIAADVAAARRDPAELPGALARIELAARAADDLARQLAAHARRQAVEPADVVPAQLLARMEPTLARVLGEDVALAVAPAGLRVAARVDPRQLELLLAQLARHLRDVLGGRGRVDVELGPDTLEPARALALALPPGEYVRVRLLAEPGAARPAEDPEHGLRLALARAVAGDVGGAVDLAAHGERGLRVEVYLPRVFAAPRAADARPVVDLRGAESLLLVEPDPTLRRTLAVVLGHLGYAVLAADDLDAALDRLSGTGPSGHVLSARFALALVSAALPGGPGEALRRLRAAAPELRLLWLAPGGAGPGAPGEPLAVPCSFEALALRVRQALDARAG